MRRFTSQLACALLLITSFGQLHAGTLIFDNLPTINANSITDETRPPEFGILAQIQVGANSVTIDQFGVWGSQLADGNIRFAIFEQVGFNRIYNSAAQVQTATVGQWFDSPVFSAITLAANTNYYFGLLSDQQFTYRWSSNNPLFTQNGLTSNAGGIAGNNGNFSNFANPTMNNDDFFVTNATRIFAPDAVAVPEPSSIAVFGIAMVGLVAGRKRIRRRQV